MSDDLRLWEGLCRGEAKGFEDFYREQAARLRNFLHQYVGDAQVAEDLAQEAFLQLWRHPNGFHPGRGTLKAYLFGIARKRAADWWRRQPARESPGSIQPMKTENESRTVMGNALAQLLPELRSLLWLREVEGYSYAELAEILEIPLGTVKSRLFAAREELRRIWQTRPRQR